ncbi:MAG: inositol 2-dehydrogenase [Acidobacteriota bacterium]
MNQRIKVGIVGLGRLGKLYAGYFLRQIHQAELVAVADIQESVAQSFATAHQVPKWYQHHQDLLADKHVQAVVIVSPTSTHRNVVMEAANQGKAIFCEKPLSLSLQEAEEMEQRVAQKGVFFQMGFMRRFDKGYMAARKKIDEGIIGHPIVFKSCSRDPFRPSLEYLDPRHSGGLIVDCAIHDIDLARWYMGEVRSVYAVGRNLAYPEMDEIGDVDNAITTLSFRNGALGVIDNSRSGVFGYDIRTEILGTKGSLQVGYIRETPLLVLTKGEVSHDTVPYFMERFGQAYVSQLQNFVDNLVEGKEPPIRCSDGLANLKVALAATRALQEGHPVEV